MLTESVPAAEATTETSAPPLTADDILCTALDVGEGLLKNGATVHRTEDTVERICRAFGAVHVEVFCIPSLILAAVRMEDGAYSSQNRRIHASANHFYRLDRFNTVSRRLCSGEITIAQAQEEMRAIKRSDAYPTWMQYLGSLLGSGAFSIFFGGSLLDAISAALIGCLIAGIKQFLPRNVNPLSSTLVCAFTAGALSMLLTWAGLANNYDKVMIGTIMLLIPGMSFGTSLRDMLGGDIMAGMLQFLAAILLAAIIAFGYVIAIFLFQPLL